MTHQTLFLLDENPAHFERLLDELYALYQPANLQDSSLVYDSAEARWYLDRRLRVSATFEFRLHETKPDITSWTPEDLHQLNLFDRYKTQAERAFRRALTSVQTIRTQATREEYWRAQLELKKQELDLKRQKFQSSQPKETTPDAADLSKNLKAFQDTLIPVQHDSTLNCSVIVQRAFIRMEDGYGCIDQISPPNSEVRKLIENRDRYAIPPSIVVRHFTFLNEIPKGYAYLLPPNSQNLPKGRYFFRVDLDFDKFLDLAAREDLVTDRQPEPEIDESTVSDEDWLAAQRNKRQ